MPKHSIIHRFPPFIQRLLPKKRVYVIIYDEPDPEDGISMTYGHQTEQYYGYFATPAEARRVWQVFTRGGKDTYHNVKLCRILEDW